MYTSMINNVYLANLSILADDDKNLARFSVAVVPQWNYFYFRDFWLLLKIR